MAMIYQIAQQQRAAQDLEDIIAAMIGMTLTV
jgi:hypothetical protein